MEDLIWDAMRVTACQHNNLLELSLGRFHGLQLCWDSVRMVRKLKVTAVVFSEQAQVPRAPTKKSPASSDRLPVLVLMIRVACWFGRNWHPQ